MRKKGIILMRRVLKGFLLMHILLELNGEEWSYNEGCLSIPKIREDIYRHETVTLQYQDENFETHTKTFQGLPQVSFCMNMIISKENFLSIIFPR